MLYTTPAPHWNSTRQKTTLQALDLQSLPLSLSLSPADQTPAKKIDSVSSKTVSSKTVSGRTVSPEQSGDLRRTYWRGCWSKWYAIGGVRDQAEPEVIFTVANGSVFLLWAGCGYFWEPSSHSLFNKLNTTANIGTTTFSSFPTTHTLHRMSKTRGLALSNYQRHIISRALILSAEKHYHRNRHPTLTHHLLLESFRVHFLNRPPRKVSYVKTQCLLPPFALNSGLIVK